MWHIYVVLKLSHFLLPLSPCFFELNKFLPEEVAKIERCTFRGSNIAQNTDTFVAEMFAPTFRFYSYSTYPRIVVSSKEENEEKEKGDGGYQVEGVRRACSSINLPPYRQFRSDPREQSRIFAGPRPRRMIRCFRTRFRAIDGVYRLANGIPFASIFFPVTTPRRSYSSCPDQSSIKHSSRL